MVSEKSITSFEMKKKHRLPDYLLDNFFLPLLKYIFGISIFNLRKLKLLDRFLRTFIFEYSVIIHLIKT